ncbi:MAG: hypothetical protein CMP23_02940, partial [Rickettsiales bacterium]|nr:hypothetical protein [Rickettsiales bacterium]
AARQSLLAAYLAAARAAGALSNEDSAGDYGEVFLRYRYDQSPASRFRVTLLHSRDEILFDDVNLRHDLLGVAMDWQLRYSNNGQIEGLISHSSEGEAEPPGSGLYPHQRSWSDRSHRTQIRALLRERIGATGELRFGVEGAVQSRNLSGNHPDTRALPSWAALPLAELEVPETVLQGRGAWPEAFLSMAADLSDLPGPFDLRLGLRASVLNRSRQPYLSPRFAVQATLPWGTRIQGSAALQHQQRMSRLVMDRDLGSTTLLPERALHATVRIEHIFRAGLLVRGEFWLKRYDQLVVWSEPQTDQASGWSNSGKGQGIGGEATAALRRGRLDLRAAYAISRSTRASDTQLASVAAAQDQRHELDVMASLLLGQTRRWRLSAEYSLASGWPISTLSRTAPKADGSFAWSLAGLNDRRMPSQHRIAAQIEGSHSRRSLRLRGMIRLSAAVSGAGFTEDCPPLPEDDGEPPRCAALQFLPVVMPWAGLQVDW